MQMIRLSGSLLPQLLSYFWSQSIAEVLNKLLEAENEKEFFEREKVELVSSLCRSLAQEQAEEKVALNIESFAAFIESLVEKHEDKYEKVKYAKLIREILEQSDNFLFLFDQFESHQHNRTIKIETLHCLNAFLRLHLPSKNNSKISEEEIPAADSTPLNQIFAQALLKWLSSHMVHEFVSDSSSPNDI
jgi:ribosomal protein S10